MNISIEKLSKSYGPQKAVDDISFKVNTGEILGFLGPNGAGKTTTMKMITQYVIPDNGNIFIDGNSVYSKQVKRSIGYLPEHNPLYEDMPVMDYLVFCAHLQGVSKSASMDQARKMVQRCGLDVEKHKRIRELSKGYRQRVGLAQAMIHEPEILILDEPTTGLDPNQIVEIRELIKQLGREKTVILSTHILPEVEATCDRILIINKGKIVADGTSQNLRKQAEGSQIIRLKVEDTNTEAFRESVLNLMTVKNVAVVNASENIYEVTSETDMKSNRELFQLCASKNWVITEMIPIETKLEDIFRDLTMN